MNNCKSSVITTVTIVVKIPHPQSKGHELTDDVSLVAQVCFNINAPVQATVATIPYDETHSSTYPFSFINCSVYKQM